MLVNGFGTILHQNINKNKIRNNKEKKIKNKKDKK
jgi:hypothetical protein